MALEENAVLTPRARKDAIRISSWTRKELQKKWQEWCESRRWIKDQERIQPKIENEILV